ncbi:hypothetical protein C8Q80DRAFT_239041 [Daedaleopsis nitida]|nr:hypothetical protein C8Q80DRAFT_239041 [Daedaleopsis nitida]
MPNLRQRIGKLDKAFATQTSHFKSCMTPRHSEGHFDMLRDISATSRPFRLSHYTSHGHLRQWNLNNIVLLPVVRLNKDRRYVVLPVRREVSSNVSGVSRVKLHIRLLLVERVTGVQLKPMQPILNWWRLLRHRTRLRYAENQLRSPAPVNSARSVPFLPALCLHFRLHNREGTTNWMQPLILGRSSASRHSWNQCSTGCFVASHRSPFGGSLLLLNKSSKRNQHRRSRRTLRNSNSLNLPVVASCVELNVTARLRSNSNSSNLPVNARLKSNSVNSSSVRSKRNVYRNRSFRRRDVRRGA